MKKVNVKILLKANGKFDQEAAVLINDQPAWIDTEFDNTIGEMNKTLEEWKKESIEVKLNSILGSLFDLYDFENQEHIDAAKKYRDNKNISEFLVLVNEEMPLERVPDEFLKELPLGV